jgi:hypothetical protein
MKIRMMLLCLLCVPFCGAGADIGDWVVYTDRRDNPMIAAAILESPFQDQIAAVKALGLRADFNVSEIIDSLFATRSSRNVDCLEYLLRLLLSSVFPDPESGSYADADAEAELRARLRTNHGSFDNLAASLTSIEDLQLRAEILRLIPYRGDAAQSTYLLAEADVIVEMLADGRATSSQQDYILTYLRAVQKLDDGVFLEPCLSIYERSAETPVSQAARTAIESLRKRIAADGD